MNIRVISGIAKGHRIEVPRGRTVRPTSDRAREALFNILGDRVVNARFLDLYAGSGAVGIEALSRGARETVFVEKRHRVTTTIMRNLARTGFTKRARVIERDVADALRTLRRQEKTFDIVFGDPPYDLPNSEEILQLIGSTQLMTERTLIVWEHASRTPLSLAIGNLLSIKEVRYGDTSFSFFVLTP